MGVAALLLYIALHLVKKGTFYFMQKLLYRLLCSLLRIFFFKQTKNNKEILQSESVFLPVKNFLAPMKTPKVLSLITKNAQLTNQPGIPNMAISGHAIISMTYEFINFGLMLKGQSKYDVR